MTHRDRAGEPAVGELVRASESLDDVPQDPRRPSYPADRPGDQLGGKARHLGRGPGSRYGPLLIR